MEKNTERSNQIGNQSIDQSINPISKDNKTMSFIAIIAVVFGLVFFVIPMAIGLLSLVGIKINFGLGGIVIFIYAFPVFLVLILTLLIINSIKNKHRN